MQYLKDLLDPTLSSDQTPIPQFVLHYKEDSNPINLIAEYYTIKSQAIAKDNNADFASLPIIIYEKFDYAKHKAIISANTAYYRQKYDALIAHDTLIVTAITFALIVILTPLVPFVSLVIPLITPFAIGVSTAFWFGALFLIYQRARYQMEYADALTLLTTTCNWALGAHTQQNIDVEAASRLSEEALAKTPEIQEMMKNLHRVLTKKQIKHLIDDNIEKLYIEALDHYDDRCTLNIFANFFKKQENNTTARLISKELESTALKQRDAEMRRCIYGLNRNGFDVLRAFIHLSLDVCRATYNILQAYFTPDQEKHGAELTASHK